jgi:hypothetical protein
MCYSSNQEAMIMTLKELLEDENTTIENMQSYFKSVGLSHVNRRDLDKIIDRFGLTIFGLTCFSEVYKVVLERETSSTMRLWTYIIGTATIIYTLMTFIMLLK